MVALEFECISRALTYGSHGGSSVSAEILFIDDAYLHIVDVGKMIDRRGTIREDRTNIFNIISVANWRWNGLRLLHLQ